MSQTNNVVILKWPFNNGRGRLYCQELKACWACYRFFKAFYRLGQNSICEARALILVSHARSNQHEIRPESVNLVWPLSKFFLWVGHFSQQSYPRQALTLPFSPAGRWRLQPNSDGQVCNSRSLEIKPIMTMCKRMWKKSRSESWGLGYVLPCSSQRKGAKKSESIPDERRSWN